MAVCAVYIYYFCACVRACVRAYVCAIFRLQAYFEWEDLQDRRGQGNCSTHGTIAHSAALMHFVAGQ